MARTSMEERFAWWKTDPASEGPTLAAAPGMSFSTSIRSRLKKKKKKTHRFLTANTSIDLAVAAAPAAGAGEVAEAGALEAALGPALGQWSAWF